jgi:tetratricopeptide (TPR) repeat protein
MTIGAGFGTSGPGAADQAQYCNRQGIALAQGGRFPESETWFRQAVQLVPNYADALNNLANVLMFQDKFSEAIATYELAMRLLPDNPDLYNNLGHALMKQGKLEEAVSNCQQALRLRPDFPEAQNNLGIALQWQGHWEKAEACYREALRLSPNFPDAWNNLGNILRQQRKMAEAVSCYRQALQLRPDFPDSERNLGMALEGLDNLAAAEACFRELLRRRPNFAEAWNNLGNVLRQQAKLDQAVECFLRALQLKQDFPDLAMPFEGQVDWTSVEACLRRLAELRPGFPESWNNLAAVLRQQCKFDEAVKCYQEALRLQADFAQGHKNLGMTWLQLGNFEQGWAEYEWRWKCLPFRPRPFTQPPWDGSPLAGRTILLHAEQGLGDAIQFVRYAPLVKERGGSVVVECPEVLLGLLSTCRDIDRLVAKDSPLPAFDTHAPLLSLPGLFKTSRATIPADIPYLSATPELKKRWRKEIDTAEGFRIGIAWQGNPQHPGDWQRSVLLSRFAPFAKLPGVRLFSLQKGRGAEQLTEATGSFPIVDLANRFENFTDTAGALANLDLVITVDSAVAHCAGALGMEVWVLLPLVPDWRWLLEGEDSPWYPTMRLFRQTKAGDWDGVFNRLLAALKEKLPG